MYSRSQHVIRLKGQDASQNATFFPSLFNSLPLPTLLFINITPTTTLSLRINTSNNGGNIGTITGAGFWVNYSNPVSRKIAHIPRLYKLACSTSIKKVLSTKAIQPFFFELKIKKV